jgi:phosphatidylcholine synthase
MVILAVVVLLTVAMFTNLKFIHPTRTKRWRNVSLPMSVAWVVFAGWAAWVDFAEGSIAHWGLIVTSLYLVFAGIAQQIIPETIRRLR